MVVKLTEKNTVSYCNVKLAKVKNKKNSKLLTIVNGHWAIYGKNYSRSAYVM